MKRTFFILSSVTILLSAGSHAWASISVVTPSSMGGWAFAKTDDTFVYGSGTAVGQMVNGPATPPLGTGSANFDTNTNGLQGARLRNSDWFGTALNALTKLSYSTYVTDWNGQQAPYLMLYVSTDGDNSNYEDRLVFEPDYTVAQGGADAGVWQNWDALGGKWYADSQGAANVASVFNITDYLSYNSAVIVADDVHSLGGIRITSGLASDTDHFDTNVDAFTIGTAAGFTTYDFEATAAVPEASSLLVWSVLGLTIGGGSWWLRRTVAA